MDIEQLIVSRRTIKKFKQEELDVKTVESWLQTARVAPNHKMTEPWEVIFIGAETRKQLNHKTDFGAAPVVFAVLSHKGSSEVMREENLAAVSCMIQNYLLLAWSHGVGTFWSSLGVSSSVKKTLEVSEEYDVVGIFGTGFPEEIPAEKERTPIMSKVKHMK